ncbi:mutant tryptophan synthase, partial [Zopfochytrium polystomum]
RFGQFGGQVAPEALVDFLSEIEQAFDAVMKEPAFWEEFRSYYLFTGRPSLLHLAGAHTRWQVAARTWIKSKDLNHTGSHKINNALSQVLLANGKKRIIAETGARQHGVATATACAKFGLDCAIYMSA